MCTGVVKCNLKYVSCRFDFQLLNSDSPYAFQLILVMLNTEEEILFKLNLN